VADVVQSQVHDAHKSGGVPKTDGRREVVVGAAPRCLDRPPRRFSDFNQPAMPIPGVSGSGCW
jgi:hypothetical protein